MTTVHNSKHPRYLQAKPDKDSDTVRAELQEQLLRKEDILPTIESTGLSAAYCYNSCRGSKSSGDFLEVRKLSDGKLMIVMGDAAGHGTKAAPLSIETQCITARPKFRAMAERMIKAGTPEMILDQVEEELDLSSRELSLDNSIAIAMLIFDPETCELQYLNRGLPSLIRITADGGIDERNHHGMQLSFYLSGETKKPDVLQIAPGDTLFLRTDGYDEAEDEHGQMLAARVLEIASQADRNSPQKFLDSVLARVSSKGEGSRGTKDDLTALVIQF